jgi:hypothetical protein
LHSGDGYLTPEELTHIRGRLTGGAALFVLYIVIATPGIQDVVRDYELDDWETTEGTVIAMLGIQDWYLYSVDDVEYTGSKEAFRWDQTWSDNGPSLTTTLCNIVNGYASKSCTVTLPAGETLDLVFGDSTSWTSEFSMTVLTPGATTDTYDYNDGPVSYTTAGDYTIRLFDSYGDGGGYVTASWAGFGKHFLLTGSSVEVFYDPDDHDFSRLIMPEFNHRKLMGYTGFAFAGLLALALVPPVSPERKEERKKAAAQRALGAKEERKKAKQRAERSKTQTAERKAAREKADTERPAADADGPPVLLIIGGFIVLILLLDSGILEDLPSGGGGGFGLDIFGCCLAPFAAGGAALSRSSTGKFSDGQTGPSSKAFSDLAKVTYCMHTQDNGKKCRRMVMRQTGLCYQHQDSDAAVVYLEAIESDTSGDVLRYNIDGANKAISSKDIDVLIEGLGEAKKFWVVDLGLDEAEFVQFTYDGDIDDDGIRDGQPVLEHWRGGRKILTNRIGLEKSLEILRSLLHGE